MRLFVALSLLFVCGTVEARPVYIQTFVPTALASLSVTPNGWSNNTCIQCHGNAAANFGNISAGARPFGTSFFTTAQGMGFVMQMDNLDDLTQAQVQMVIAALLPLDADGDGSTNEQELRGRSDFNDPTSTPASVGGGGSDDPCDVVPELCSASGSSESGANGKVVSADAAYQLNSGCGVNDRNASLAGKEINHAGVPAPLAG
ncbi:MAG: hypothetical protein ABL958_12505, partial [Bdellovibrionia bacterium]